RPPGGGQGPRVQRRASRGAPGHDRPAQLGVRRGEGRAARGGPGGRVARPGRGEGGSPRPHPRRGEAGEGRARRRRAVIELRGLSRHFEVGDQIVRALQDINLTIPDGDYLALMGPSGSGKSTLLHILGCLDRPTEGTYVLDGREVGSLPESELAAVRSRKIGFVFQFFHLVPRLTAAGNVE